MKTSVACLTFILAGFCARAMAVEQEEAFDRVVRENHEHQRRAVDGLDQALHTLATQIIDSKAVVRAVMLVNCNTIVRVTTIYGDGRVFVTKLGDIQATDAELAEQAANYPFMRIVSECSR